MLPERRMFEDEECPVSVDVLGAMYRASPHGLKELIESVPQSVRGMLAMYCYRRAHLSSIAIAIAATCEEEDLTRYGGNAGAILYAKSREAASAPRLPANASSRRKITLASGALRNMVPPNDELEDIETEAETEVARANGAAAANEDAPAEAPAA
jgi:hypothetical protein